MADIVVDFDGTLHLGTEKTWPEIGEPNTPLIVALREARQRGHRVFLFTCRQGDILDAALKFCRKHGLEFDFANENCPGRIEQWGECRKISGDLIIDDRAAGYSTEVAIRAIHDLDREDTPCERAYWLAHHQRQRQYGHPRINFARTAQLWTPVFYTQREIGAGRSVYPEQVPLANMLQKISRSVHDDDEGVSIAYNRELPDDVCGYSEAMYMMEQAE